MGLLRDSANYCDVTLAVQSVVHFSDLFLLHRDETRLSHGCWNRQFVPLANNRNDSGYVSEYDDEWC